MSSPVIVAEHRDAQGLADESGPASDVQQFGRERFAADRRSWRQPRVPGRTTRRGRRHSSRPTCRSGRRRRADPPDPAATSRLRGLVGSHRSTVSCVHPIRQRLPSWGRRLREGAAEGVDGFHRWPGRSRCAWSITRDLSHPLRWQQPQQFAAVSVQQRRLPTIARHEDTGAGLAATSAGRFQVRSLGESRATWICHEPTLEHAAASRRVQPNTPPASLRSLCGSARARFTSRAMSPAMSPSSRRRSAGRSSSNSPGRTSASRPRASKATIAPSEWPTTSVCPWGFRHHVLSSAATDLAAPIDRTVPSQVDHADLPAQQPRGRAHAPPGATAR